jgi:hypothetical protein
MISIGLRLLLDKAKIVRFFQFRGDMDEGFAAGEKKRRGASTRTRRGGGDHA